MKKIIFKTALALCATFTIGSIHLQDSTGAKPVVEDVVISSCKSTLFILPINLPKKP